MTPNPLSVLKELVEATTEFHEVVREFVTEQGREYTKRANRFIAALDAARAMASAPPQGVMLTDEEILAACKQADNRRATRRRLSLMLRDDVKVGDFQAALVRAVRAVLSKHLGSSLNEGRMRVARMLTLDELWQCRDAAKANYSGQYEAAIQRMFMRVNGLTLSPDSTGWGQDYPEPPVREEKEAPFREEAPRERAVAVRVDEKAISAAVPALAPTGQIVELDYERCLVAIRLDADIPLGMEVQHRCALTAEDVDWWTGSPVLQQGEQQ